MRDALYGVGDGRSVSLSFLSYASPNSQNFPGSPGMRNNPYQMTRLIQHPEFFSLRDKFAICRPIGTLSLEEAVRLIDDSLYYCRANGITRLLANVIDAVGFPSPSLTDRFWFVSKWAETAHGRVTFALVVPADMILPDKMGVTFAANRGLSCDAFSNENEAIQWLSSAPE